jgi:hypothetical protein
MNEEMYEEEDNDMPSQLRRLNALHGITGPLGERFQSSLAMQLGMREALSQALLRNQQYQNANATANAEASAANGFMNPMIQPNMMMSSPNMPDAFGNQQSWQMQQQPQQFPQHDRPMLSSSGQNNSQQHMPAYFPQNPNFTLQLDKRRSTMPLSAKDSASVKSPMASHPSTPHNLIPSTTPGASHDSPQQVPTPPHSASAYTPGQSSSAGSPLMTAGKPITAMQRFTNNNNSDPLTLQLPTETQQILGMGFPMNNNFSPMMKSATSPTGAYTYNPNGMRAVGNGRNTSFHDMKSAPGMMYSPHSFYHPNQQSQFQDHLHTPLTGLNQTISPSALSNLDSSFTAASTNMPSSTFPESSLDYNNNSGFFNPGCSFDNFGDDAMAGPQSGMYSLGGPTHGGGDSGWNTPGLNNEPSWNPEDFVDFGQPST